MMAERRRREVPSMRGLATASIPKWQIDQTKQRTFTRENGLTGLFNLSHQGVHSWFYWVRVFTCPKDSLRFTHSLVESFTVFFGTELSVVVGPVPRKPPGSEKEFTENSVKIIKRSALLFPHLSHK